MAAQVCAMMLKYICRRSVNSLMMIYVVYHLRPASAFSVCEHHKTVFSTVFRGIIGDGPSNYKSNQRCEWLIASPDPDKYPFVTLEFLSILTECAYDYIMIHDGDSYDSPLIATLSGSSTSKKVLAQRGKMLVYLFSDRNTEFDGFNASFTISECPNNCTGNGRCLDNKCYCDSTWTGTDCSKRPCPYNCGGKKHGECRTETVLKKCNCKDGFIGRGCRLNVNAVERGGYWTVVYDYDVEPGSIRRAGHTAAYTDSYYYVFGGFDMEKPLAELQRFNFQANEWLLLHSPIQPTARFFHSMTSVTDHDKLTYFLLYGGDQGDDHLNNETWMYDTQSNSWRMHIPSANHPVMPALCQHTATLIEIDNAPFVYIFGGRNENSREYGLSSDMHRFDWRERMWEKVVYDPSGVKPSRLRVAGHSMVYDPMDKTLVLFGGLRMNPYHKVVSSSTVFLYSVTANRWAEVVASDEPGPFSYNIEPRAFHSADVVGDYMIVHGGHLRNPTLGPLGIPAKNLCYSSQTHFYNLRSHAWVKELRESSDPAPLKLYSHTAAIMNDIVMLVHGGYNGVTSHQLLAYKLPNLITVNSVEVAKEECPIHKDEATCGADYFHGCIWIDQECKSGLNELPIYGSVCQHLKDCVSCTTFKSYVRNSSYGWNSSSCAWCVQDSTCYPLNNRGRLGACDASDKVYEKNPWWDVGDIKLLQSSGSCLLENIQPGILAEEYRRFPNFSQPDNVLFLTKLYLDLKHDNLFGDYLVRIRGFLRLDGFEGSYVKMRLLSVKGKSRISLSSNDSPTILRVILNGSDSNIPAESNLLNLNKSPNSRYFIDILFNHSGFGHWSGKFEAEFAAGDKKDDFKFSTISASHLEPYQSLVITDSSTIPPCSTLKNCLACLADKSCAWYNFESLCISRSTLALESIASKEDLIGGLPHFGIITEPESCVVCQDYSTCLACVASSRHCEWRGNEDAQVKCVRRGSTDNNSTSHLDHCPSHCYERSDCVSCLRGVNEFGISQRCAWCSTTQKCYLLSRYHLAAYPFGQCALWVDEEERCPSCSVHKDCNTCLQTYECGWCSHASNPLQGYCTRGGYAEPEVTCDASNLDPGYQSSNLYEMLWSYGRCPDINECVMRDWSSGNVLHSCHANARCINTDGDYICICNTGYQGNGQHCQRTCLTECKHGQCSGPPDYRCTCDLGWMSSPNVDGGNVTGVACNINCNCNFLSTCNSGQGICDSCQLHSTGLNCEECIPGYFHISGTGLGCQRCLCNGHGISRLNVCDQITGDCYCQHNTEGKHCDSCKAGYFGDPSDGGVCYSKCEGRLKLVERSGAFGSWESLVRQYGSVLRRKLDNEKASVRISCADCQWTVEVKNYTNEDGALMITIEKDINVPCYKSNVFIYDGVIGVGETKLLGEYCGSRWEKNEIVYARSGRATIQFRNVFMENQLQKFGFTARYEVQPYCSETIFDEIAFSGQSEAVNEENNMHYTPQNTAWLLDKGCHLPAVSGCFNNCSSLGFCKMGLCQCFSNFTGLDCSVDASSITSSVNLQLEWSQRFFKGVGPGRHIGHVLIGIGSSLWLHAGLSQSGKISDDLWRYDITDREWILIEIGGPRPPGRYFHAASMHTPDKFYIYGGNVVGSNSSSEIWVYAIDGTWHEVVMNSSLPPLAGHTFTFCGGPVAYIIGGYNRNSGFNEKIWSFNSKNQDVASVSRSIISPPLLYGHSAVCDNNSGFIYVYGGLEASFFEFPSPTDSAYAFNTNMPSWKPLASSAGNGISPSPRSFHSAVNHQLGNSQGMLVLGGRLSSSQTTDEIWFLNYNCSSWKRLLSNVRELASTLVGGIPTFASVASYHQNHYLFGGFQNGIASAELIVMSVLPVDNESDQQIEQMCTDAADIPTCYSYRNCHNCLEHSSCYWCQSSFHPVEGECVPLNKACRVGHDLVKENQKCDSCIGLPLVACDARRGCSWTYTEVMDDYYDKLLRSCFCRKDPSNTDNDSTLVPTQYQPKWPANATVGKDYSHECPGSCSVHKSCDACLNFPDSYGVWWHCVWSHRLQKCLDPSYVPIACPPGGPCGSLAAKGTVSCPLSSCSELQSCWECINKIPCYWLQMGSLGKCVDISEHKELNSSDVKFYYNCPPEDECANNVDDCLEDEIFHEKCHDLREGYECLCEDGYERNSPSLPCSPVCSQGCLEGKCLSPNICVCNFGYTGDDCNTACQCNGHSDCQDAVHPEICLLCHNNTIGNQCESCKKGFAGDPTRNRSCEKCRDVCHGKSDNCRSKSENTNGHGPTHDDAICVDCRGHSHGDYCEGCKEGYFKFNGACRKCECNGHSDMCDEETGGFCKCQNQTMSSDERCSGPKNSQDPYPSDCWKKQCDKCKASYQGDPKDGGICYRHVTIEQNMCFSAQSPTHCPSVDYGDSEDNFLHHVLPAGQTVTFALNPKFTNVDIRIIVDVTQGELSLFLSDRYDAFRIILDSSSTSHKVLPDEQFVSVGRHKRGYGYGRSQLQRVRRKRSFNSANRVEADENLVSGTPDLSYSRRIELDIVNASYFNSYVTLPSYTALRIDGIRNRLVVTVPHTGFDLKSKKFYVILLGQQFAEPVVEPKPTNAAPKAGRSKRSIGVNTYQVVDKTVGQLVFRQDQAHIDLFVFFSVFFSCFFLFLAICIVAWKIKQFMDERGERQTVRIALQQMASRPFAKVCVTLDSYVPHPLSHSSDIIPIIYPIARDGTMKLFQVRSCPLFVTDEGASTSGSGSAPNSSSLPNSPGHRPHEMKGAPVICRRVADSLSLDSTMSHTSKHKRSSQVRSISQEAKYSCDLTDQLLVVHGNVDVLRGKVPLLNSTTTYIKHELDFDNVGQLTPLSSCISRTPSPIKQGEHFTPDKPIVHATVSVDCQGRIRTFGKRRAFPLVMDGRRDLSYGIFEPRTEYCCSLPSLPEKRHQPRYGIALPENPQLTESVAKPGCILKNLSHTAATFLKDESTVGNVASKATMPLSCEVTDNGFASVNTVLLQLPGGSKAPVLVCFGSALITASTICGSSLADSIVCKQRFKSRNSKL